ncbi:hypothetical protein NUW58_g4937 [Xylaria curta]|uniref:Uncharacterized protein n=1 Tax=Xylaria curta TaxID=42375 RepID=A0ACC1P4N3_9PEZI|nr:hypothetical protein NUW58_g4937 [Xylaria curta]
MPHAETEWKIIYFEEEEPEDTVSRLPIAGHASLLKILVPHNQISKYTKQEEGGAGGAHVLKNQDSNILVTILTFQRKDVMEEGYWGPLAQFHAEWDRRPEQDGFLAVMVHRVMALKKDWSTLGVLVEYGWQGEEEIWYEDYSTS